MRTTIIYIVVAVMGMYGLHVLLAPVRAMITERQRLEHFITAVGGRMTDTGYDAPDLETLRQHAAEEQARNDARYAATVNALAD